MKPHPLIANEEAEPARGRCRIDTHLCFGNFKGRAVGRRVIRSLFPVSWISTPTSFTSR